MNMKNAIEEEKVVMTAGEAAFIDRFVAEQLDRALPDHVLVEDAHQLLWRHAPLARHASAAQ